MGRAPCCDRATVKRGPWSPDEDEALRGYIQKNGTGGNWIALPQKAGLNRCGKSCRLRWLNYLRPDIKHGGFTEHDDTTIISLYHQIGSKWSVIASKMPGRTDNDIKNYWNTKLKKKYMIQKLSNITASHPTQMVAPQPPPPPPLAFFAGMNPEELVNTDFALYQEEQIATKYMISATETADNLTGSVSDEASSAASSSVTVENYNCMNMNWSRSGYWQSDEFLLLSDQLEFDAAYGDNYLLNLTNMADYWVNFEVKAEGFFNSLAPLY